jgi:hypothetical protein
LAGRTPSEAARKFREPIQQALSCISERVISIADEGGRYVLTLASGEPARLKGNAGLFLSVTIRYRVVAGKGDAGPWKVSVTAYIYELSELSHDGKSQVVLGYHWHPGVGSVATPHLHLGPEVATAHLDRKKHLPTGRVSLEQVIRVAIEELGVISLRPGWRRILDRTQARFEKYRTWS